MKTGTTPESSSIVWYWVEEEHFLPLTTRQLKRKWCRDQFGFLWQNTEKKWYFINEKDRLLFILTWM